MRSRASGTTLIEVLIALAVLVIGLTAASATVIYASKSTSTGMHVEQATTMAQSLLTTLLAVPFTASGAGNSASPNNFFFNTTTANDADVADSAGNFKLATLPVNSYDHIDTELPANLLAMVAVQPAGGITYQRYWNIAPIGATPGRVIAVIVRWQEGDGSWQRTVVVGTRYQQP
jgi:prepilin-type N-terminal cleavage/methylation domain-containing protein